MRVSNLCRAALLFSVLAFIGCDKTHESTLTGKVTYKGEPAGLVMINFHFDGKGPMAYAVSEENGRYEAMVGSRRGLKPGKYRVALEAAMGPKLPEKYNSVETSDLMYEVKPGRNKIDIELE